MHQDSGQQSAEELPSITSLLLVNGRSRFFVPGFPQSVQNLSWPPFFHSDVHQRQFIISSPINTQNKINIYIFFKTILVMKRWSMTSFVMHLQESSTGDCFTPHCCSQTCYHIFCLCHFHYFRVLDLRSLSFSFVQQNVNLREPQIICWEAWRRVYHQ